MSSLVDRIIDNPNSILQIDSNQGDAFLNIFGCLGLEIRCPDGNVIDLGMGSIGAIKSLRYYYQPKLDAPALNVGRFTEFSECEILIGGKHSTRTLANFSFSSNPFIARDMTQSGAMKTVRPITKPISIGSGCVFSRNVLVLPGSEVGDGCVVGAGAVVNSKLPPFCIAAGNPAIAKAQRFDDDQITKYQSIDIASLSVVGMLKLNATIHSGADIGTVDWSAHRDQRKTRVIFDCAIEANSQKLHLRNLLGATIDGKYINPSELPPEFIGYLKQGTDLSGRQINWIADPFSYYEVNVT